MKKPFLIIVAGGSASGKTTVVNQILKLSGVDNVARISQDDYYKDQSNVPMEKRLEVNYDHPEAIDSPLLQKHIEALLNQEVIEKPIYDFMTYNRLKETETVKPQPIIIVEGILALMNPDLRELSALKIFVDTDDDLRLIRRILRDVKERGRSIDSIVSQYLNSVKPMYHKYVKPTIRFADIIIPNDQKHDAAVDLVVAKLKQIKEQI